MAKQVSAESNNNSLDRETGPAGEFETRVAILFHTHTQTCWISSDYTPTEGDYGPTSASLSTVVR